MLCVDLGCSQSFKDYYNRLWRVRGSSPRERVRGSRPRETPPRSLPPAHSSTGTVIPGGSGGQSYKDFYNQRWRSRGPRTRDTSSTPPVLSDSPSADMATSTDTAGQSYTDFYNQRWRSRGPRTRDTPSTPPVLSDSSPTDTGIPADIAALVPPGSTSDDIPKSQLAGK